MKQFIYTHKIYIQGTFTEVLQQLKTLSRQHRTLKELLDSKWKPL